MKSTTRYMRELRVTIHDMYGNYKNTPKYEISGYNKSERALGIDLYGASNIWSNLNFFSFIQKIENHGWYVIGMEPRFKHSKLGNTDINIDTPYLFLEVRKIEEIDIDTTKHEAGDIQQKIVSCDLCTNPRAYTHKSGLEICQEHYNNMVRASKTEPDCSCQEVGHDCCERHSEEPPNIDEGIVKTKLVKKQAD